MMEGVPHSVKGQAQQLGLPGVMSRPAMGIARPQALGVGQEVVYLGMVPGGPPKGAWGRVRRVTPRGVWVHFSAGGSWLVPPYFLRVPLNSGAPPQSSASPGSP